MTSMTFMICRELNPPRIVKGFTERIAEHADNYQPITRDAWLVNGEQNSDFWKDQLRSFMGARDTLLIIEIANNYTGWAPETIWNWLQAALGKSE